MAIYKTLDRATLERLYVAEGLSLKEVAARIGIPIRVPGQSMHPALDLTHPRVERLYVGLGLPIGDVALLVDRSRTAVALALRRHGIEPRRLLPQPQPRVGGRARARFAAADVRQLADDGLSADEIA